VPVRQHVNDLVILAKVIKVAIACYIWHTIWAVYTIFWNDNHEKHY